MAGSVWWMYTEELFSAQFLEIPGEPDFLKVCLIRPFKGNNIRAPGMFGMCKELFYTGINEESCPKRECFHGNR